MTAQGAARRRASARNQDRTALSKPNRNGGGPTKAQPEKGARGGADAARQRNGGDGPPDDLVGADHLVPPLTSENSVVKVTAVMYVRCESPLGHVKTP
jgi:hypothetical protein